MELISSQRFDQDVLSKDQSLALVKIFLNASVACICHTRELINWEAACFRKRYVDQISLDVDNVYDSFCGPEPLVPGSSQEIRVLVRGTNGKADALLDMIVRSSPVFWYFSNSVRNMAYSAQSRLLILMSFRYSLQAQMATATRCRRPIPTASHISITPSQA